MLFRCIVQSPGRRKHANALGFHLSGGGCFSNIAEIPPTDGRKPLILSRANYSFTSCMVRHHPASTSSLNAKPQKCASKITALTRFLHHQNFRGGGHFNAGT